MPLTYRIDAGRNLVLTTGTGVLTDEDVLAHKRALIEDPAFVTGMRELSDVRAVEELRVTPDGVRLMVGLDEKHARARAGCKLAIVAGQPLIFGMARMYQQSAEPSVSDVGVFKDHTQALAWLGLDPIEA
jgi:hypothetical protein